MFFLFKSASVLSPDEHGEQVLETAHWKDSATDCFIAMQNPLYLKGQKGHWKRIIHKILIL